KAGRGGTSWLIFQERFCLCVKVLKARFDGVGLKTCKRAQQRRRQVMPHFTEHGPQRREYPRVRWNDDLFYAYLKPYRCSMQWASPTRRQNCEVTWIQTPSYGG